MHRLSWVEVALATNAGCQCIAVRYTCKYLTCLFLMGNLWFYHFVQMVNSSQEHDGSEMIKSQVSHNSACLVAVVLGLRELIPTNLCYITTPTPSFSYTLLKIIQHFIISHFPVLLCVKTGFWWQNKNEKNVNCTVVSLCENFRVIRKYAIPQDSYDVSNLYSCLYSRVPL